MQSRPAIPGEVLAAWRGPLHHVGEADPVLPRQGVVVHVVQLDLAQPRHEETLPCGERSMRLVREPGMQLAPHSELQLLAAGSSPGLLPDNCSPRPLDTVSQTDTLTPEGFKSSDLSRKPLMQTVHYYLPK